MERSRAARPGPKRFRWDTILADSARAARTLARLCPRGSLFTADGRVIHEAGGSQAQELAFDIDLRRLVA